MRASSLTDKWDASSHLPAKSPTRPCPAANCLSRNQESVSSVPLDFHGPRGNGLSDQTLRNALLLASWLLDPARTESIQLWVNAEQRQVVLDGLCCDHAIERIRVLVFKPGSPVH